MYNKANELKSNEKDIQIAHIWLSQELIDALMMLTLSKSFNTNLNKMHTCNANLISS